MYFKIGEVARLVGVKPHVLRYWESEFPALQPVKSPANQRLYRRADIEQALLIKSLLYQQGFTVSGARHKLKSRIPGSLLPQKNLEQIIEQMTRLRDRLQAEIERDSG